MKRLPEVIDPTSFGAKIHKLRTDAGIPQIELAYAVGLAPNSISYYENGKAMPSLDLAVQIANYFHVSLDALLGRDEFNEYNKATIKSIAGALVQISMLEGVQIRSGDSKSKMVIEFDSNELAYFLDAYAHLLSSLCFEKNTETRTSKLSRSDRTLHLIETLSDTPISALKLDEDTFLGKYNRNHFFY